MSADEYQIGGEHYKGTYQHWNFVEDTGIGYLLGCATKYISRWRKKNGVQDLKKSLHYISKFQERSVYRKTNYEYWDMFIKPMRPTEINIMLALYNGEFEKAKTLIERIITDQEEQPTHGYVNQD